jgi:hypothetical protein
VSGKENLIRIYDYFLRGKLIAAMQSFTGHAQYASRLLIQNDMRAVFSLGPSNGIYKWAFYGDKEIPDDLSMQFEKSKREQVQEEAKD